MKLKVSHHQRPFSHEPGSMCIIPFSSWKLSAYPSRFLLENLIEKEQIEIKFSIKGPVKDFTVQQDLQDGFVIVFGFSANGYFRFKLSQDISGLSLFCEKIPEKDFSLYVDQNQHVVEPSNKILLSNKNFLVHPKNSEKLFAGSLKAQDWSMIRKRCDLTEIIPLWLRLGQMVPSIESPAVSEGVLELLRNCQDYILQKDVFSIKESLHKIFLAGFSSMLSPRLFDDEYQGIIPFFSYNPELNPLQILTLGSQYIRSLFFNEKEGAVQILPCLLPDFHAGRLMEFASERGDKYDVSWSKKQVRAVIVSPKSDGEVLVEFPKSIKRFRIRKKLTDKGVFLSAGTKIQLTKDQLIYLDRFQV